MFLQRERRLFLREGQFFLRQRHFSLRERRLLQPRGRFIFKQSSQ